MRHYLTSDQVKAFQSHLQNEEKSQNTISKYTRDLRKFFCFCEDNPYISKETVLQYKEFLSTGYALSSANSMLAALNSFFQFIGWHDCVIKTFKSQQAAFRPQEKELTMEEYWALVHAAQGKNAERMSLLIQTIAATGIRISELPFITVEAVHAGRTQVTLKGKSRVVVIPGTLCLKLKNYAERKRITTGSIFVTKSGRPMDRSNICRTMKRLGKLAGISEEKLFPHNLRHLFAVRYYETEHDLARLADILGHSSVNTTRIYTMVSSEEHMQAINQMGMVV